jgi:DNA modification methylase
LIGPVYESDLCTVYHGDCLDVMASLGDGEFDAIVTDPPYCSGSVSEASRVAAKGQGLRSEILRRFGWFTGDNMGTAGLAYLLRSVAVEATRVVRPTGSVLMFCDWRMVANLAPAIESAGLRMQNLLVWDKGSMGLGTGFRTQHEMILHYTLGSPEYHAADVGNVIRSRRVSKEDRDHQTQKPVELMEDIVRVVCPLLGTVLDPFGGSGTTALACIRSGRNCVIIERDPGHVETAVRRVKDAEGVGSLFEGAAR